MDVHKLPVAQGQVTVVEWGAKGQVNAIAVPCGGMG